MENLNHEMRLYQHLAEWEKAGQKWMINSPRVLREFLEHNDEVLKDLVAKETELKNLKAAKEPIKLDWSKVKDELNEKLFPPAPDLSNRAVTMAQDIERKMFTYMLFAGISKVYVWTETETVDTDTTHMCTLTWHFGEHRPSHSWCTEHDFQNLLDMSDEEFAQLPSSPNTGLVKSWREMMRNKNA